MTPILITLILIVPILALGTWAYLRRRSFSPRTRILLGWLVFLFVLFSGPTIYLVWRHERVSHDLLSTGRAGLRLLNEIGLLWLIGVITIGVQLFRLCCRKGEL